ncbi:M14 family metallopeptidase [Marinibactrum sp. C21]|nr:M14 family metallopeptidase [Sessilibacter corallicola]
MCDSPQYHHTFYEHPLVGMSGETLGIDVAITSNKNAQNLVIIISGTHGVEGYLGSMVQTQLLERYRQCDLSNTNIMCVHALNPYGFSFGMRVNEDNVDVNRNFTDFNGDLPINRNYQRVHDILYHADDEHIDIDRNLKHFFTSPQLAENIHALTLGQHTCDDGLFFGGKASSWSRSVLEKIITSHTASVDKTVVVDIHTGLGKYGYGQPMSFSPANSIDLLRTKTIFGPSLGAPKESQQISSDIDGNLYDGIARCYQGTELTSIALEFGTYTESVILKELLTESVLRNKSGSPTDYSPLRDCFFIQRDDWLEMALFRSQQVISQAITYLEG